jgi:hypothetical protein
MTCALSGSSPAQPAEGDVAEGLVVDGGVTLLTDLFRLAIRSTGDVVRHRS